MSPPPAPPHFRKAKNREVWIKAFNWIISLLGLWEFGDIAALFVPDFGRISAFVWNHILVGFLLMIAGAWAALTKRPNVAQSLNWVAAAAGLWLIIAPFVLGRPEHAAGLWNDWIVGGLVIIAAVWSALVSRRRESKA